MYVVQYINKFKEIYLVVVRKMWLTPICLYFVSLFLAKTSSPSPEVLNSITCLKAHHLRHPTSVVSLWMEKLTENTEQTANSHHESSPFRLVGWVSFSVIPIPGSVSSPRYIKWNRGTSSLFSQVRGTPVGWIGGTGRNKWNPKNNALIWFVKRPYVLLERQCQRVVRKLTPTASYETRT